MGWRITAKAGGGKGLPGHGRDHGSEPEALTKLRARTLASYWRGSKKEQRLDFSRPPMKKQDPVVLPALRGGGGGELRGRCAEKERRSELSVLAKEPCREKQRRKEGDFCYGDNL